MIINNCNTSKRIQSSTHYYKIGNHWRFGQDCENENEYKMRIHIDYSEMIFNCTFM